jgi:hypothetical protein
MRSSPCLVVTSALTFIGVCPISEHVSKHSEIFATQSTWAYHAVLTGSRHSILRVSQHRILCLELFNTTLHEVELFEEIVAVRLQLARIQGCLVSRRGLSVGCVPSLLHKLVWSRAGLHFSGGRVFADMMHLLIIKCGKHKFDTRIHVAGDILCPGLHVHSLLPSRG